MPGLRTVFRAEFNLYSLSDISSQIDTYNSPWEPCYTTTSLEVLSGLTSVNGINTTRTTNLSSTLTKYSHTKFGLLGR